MRRKLVISLAGIAGALTSCTPCAVEDDRTLEEKLAGDWVTERGVVFHFDERGVLDYFGKEQFGELAYDNGLTREITYNGGKGILTDTTQMLFTGSDFESILIRNFNLHGNDFGTESYAIIVGNLNGCEMELKVDALGDFFGTGVEEGLYRLTKRD